MTGPFESCEMSILFLTEKKTLGGDLIIMDLLVNYTNLYSGEHM